MILKSGALLFGAAVFHNLPFYPLVVRAQSDPKRIYIAPDDHTDYLWTGDEEDYRRAFLNMLDYYLDLAESTADNPSDYQSRWNCDGSFWVWTYEKNKTPAEFERLIERIRSGHINVPLNPLVVLLGGAPAEAVLRGMYYAGTLERRFDLRFPMAVSMENQTFPYGLSSLWAGAGAKYSWKGICNCATKVVNAGQREHDIYWAVGPDGSRVLMKWNSLLVDNKSIGGYAEARDPAAIVDFVDNNAAFARNFPYNVIGAFGRGWDDLETYTDEFVQVARDLSDERRRVIVSNEVDFFEDFASTYGTDLPEMSVSFGNEWELYCASMAEVSAGVKRMLERLRSAEALAAIITVHDPTFMDGRAEARELAWMSLGLYWEHNWTADSNIISREQRGTWQRSLLSTIEAYINPLFHDARNAFGRLIQLPGGSNPRFYVFNPLNWPRDDIADIPFGSSGAHSVIDLATGQETPSQLVMFDDVQYLRVLATDIPAIGYKTFEIRPAEGESFPDAATISANVIENDRYRLTLAENGAITSLIDKQAADREFAREIDGRFINDLGGSSGTLSVENAGPVSVTLRADADGPLAHSTRVTLYRAIDRIDIRNDITQNFGDLQMWAFNFNLDNPDVWHEEVGAVIRAKLVDDGGHYSPRNARYDWLTLNHFADMSDDSGAGLTLSNADCYYFQLGQSSNNTLDTLRPQINVLVGGQVDGPSLGIPDQHGDTHFMQRFALRTRPAFDPTAAMRFALDHQNPLVTGIVTGDEKSHYSAQSASIFEVGNPDVLLWALKPSEDDATTIIVRLWNLSDTPQAITLTVPDTTLSAANSVTHIETPIADLPLTDGTLNATINPRQISTFQLILPSST